MIIIEVYGESFNNRNSIDAALVEVELAQEATIAFIPSICEKCNSQYTDAPFIRVCYTKPDKLEKLVSALQNAMPASSIVILLLNGFYPAIEMK